MSNHINPAALRSFSKLDTANMCRNFAYKHIYSLSSQCQPLCLRMNHPAISQTGYNHFSTQSDKTTADINELRRLQALHASLTEKMENIRDLEKENMRELTRSFGRRHGWKLLSIVLSFMSLSSAFALYTQTISNRNQREQMIRAVRRNIESCMSYITKLDQLKHQKNVLEQEMSISTDKKKLATLQKLLSLIEEDIALYESIHIDVNLKENDIQNIQTYSGEVDEIERTDYRISQ